MRMHSNLLLFASHLLVSTDLSNDFHFSVLCLICVWLLLLFSILKHRHINFLDWSKGKHGMESVCSLLSYGWCLVALMRVYVSERWFGIGLRCTKHGKCRASHSHVPVVPIRNEKSFFCPVERFARERPLILRSVISSLLLLREQQRHEPTIQRFNEQRNSNQLMSNAFAWTNPAITNGFSHPKFSIAINYFLNHLSLI